MATPDATLTRKQIKALFQRNRGTAAALARQLEISPVTVTQWLGGKVVSARIAEAAQLRAAELLGKEQSAA